MSASSQVFLPSSQAEAPTQSFVATAQFCSNSLTLLLPQPTEVVPIIVLRKFAACTLSFTRATSVVGVLVRITTANNNPMARSMTMITSPNISVCPLLDIHAHLHHSERIRVQPGVVNKYWALCNKL